MILATVEALRAALGGDDGLLEGYPVHTLEDAERGGLSALALPCYVIEPQSESGGPEGRDVVLTTRLTVAAVISAQDNGALATLNRMVTAAREAIQGESLPGVQGYLSFQGGALVEDVPVDGVIVWADEYAGRDVVHGKRRFRG